MLSNTPPGVHQAPLHVLARLPGLGPRAGVARAAHRSPAQGARGLGARQQTALAPRALEALRVEAAQRRGHALGPEHLAVAAAARSRVVIGRGELAGVRRGPRLGARPV